MFGVCLTPRDFNVALIKGRLKVSSLQNYIFNIQMKDAYSYEITEGQVKERLISNDRKTDQSYRPSKWGRGLLSLSQFPPAVGLNSLRQ